MTNNKQAFINFTVGSIDPVLDEFAARLDGLGFPVSTANLDDGTVIVDSSSDPDEDSVLMAVSHAIEAVEISDSELLGVVAV